MKTLLFLAVMATAAVRHSTASTFPHLSGCLRWQYDKDVNDDPLKERLERLASRQQRFSISGPPTVKLGVCATADEKDSSNAGVIVQGGTGQPVVFGRLTDVFLSGNKEWISLSYSKGDAINATVNGAIVLQERSATIVFLCDSSASNPFVQRPGQGDTTQTYSNHLLLIIVSSEACESSGGSFFGTLFMILLVVGLLYLVIGFLYNRLVKGARGFEQIPNYNTWCYLVQFIQEKTGSMTDRDAYTDNVVGGGDRSAFGANRDQSDDAQLLGREELNQGRISQRLHPVTDSDNDDRLLPL